jgi:two-component system OmpR family response regulator
VENVGPASTASSALLARRDGTRLRVLVVDDEPNLREVLVRTLHNAGWDSVGAATGHEAIQLATTFGPDVVVLDIMLPDIDGYAVLRALRAAEPNLCVLFLSAQDAPGQRLAGLTAGGDDYVTKPFSLEEVLVRLRGLVRRAGLAHDPKGTRPGLRFADLVMDEDAHEVRRGGHVIALTATEFELLRFLMGNPRRVLSKNQILDHVWRYDFGGSAHVVELYISYLRKKIDADRPPLIHTVRGVGYVLRDPDS